MHTLPHTQEGLGVASLGDGCKGSSAVTGTSSRTVRGIPGNNGIAVSTYERAACIAVPT